MNEICPRCGYDLEADKPIRRWPLEMIPYGDVRWYGQKIDLWPSERAVLWTLLKAEGRPLRQYVIAERIGYERDHPTNLIGVLASNIRRKCEPIAPISIRSRKGMVSLDLSSLAQGG